MAEKDKLKKAIEILIDRVQDLKPVHKKIRLYDILLKLFRLSSMFDLLSTKKKLIM